MKTDTVKNGELISSSVLDANCLDLFNNVLTEEEDLRSFLGPKNCDANDKSTSLAIKSYLKLCSVTNTKQWQVNDNQSMFLESFNNTETTKTNRLTDQSVMTLVNDEVIHIKQEEIEEINLENSQSESINPNGTTFVSMMMKKGTKRKCIYCQNRTYFQCCKCSAVTCREHASYICIECVT